MFLPKRNIVCVVSFLFVFANFSIYANTSINTSTLYEQLCKLNKEWKTKQFNDAIFFQKRTFDTDEELIQTHLKLVEQKLRKKNIDHLPEDVQKTRLKNLDILKEYWKIGLFPKNLYHKERTPYFIDDYGTACAVGYLVIKAGRRFCPKNSTRK